MKKIKLPTGVFEYNPKELLGKSGGFGQVFLGRTSSGEVVAVKKLHISAADAAHRELRIADELKGKYFEHVMPFIDSGEDADRGEYFLIMPKADRSLQSALEENGKFNASDAAAALLQILKGLNEVENLVHRDLKPDNVLWHDGRWKVADFGIARFMEEATASNTLKDCLSPFYAAPEQWRFQRATRATDIYALGCIGFFLLTGSPPFIAQPEEEHQNTPFPSFECTDGRLKALINNMVRKLPETRPAAARVHDILNEIATKPQPAASSPLTALAAVGAQIAEKEQQLQAKLAAEQSQKRARGAIGKEANEILRDNIERLWGKIHTQVPNAHRISDKRGVFECKLGSGSLALNLSDSNHVEPNSFPHSGWDVIAASQILVDQERPQYQWSSSLWYVKRKGENEYRWQEVSYWSWSSRRAFQPFACSATDADYAASNITHTATIAFGPVPIDDEKEDEFHERWI